MRKGGGDACWPRLPSPELALQAQPYDLNRMVLLYFAVAGLDLLGYAFAEDQRRGLVDAVYAMQVPRPD